MPKRKPSKKITSQKHAETNSSIEKQDFFNSLFGWWNHLNTSQRLILLACGFIMLGGASAIIYAISRSNTTNENSDTSLLTQQGFFKQPLEINSATCRFTPLKKQPIPLHGSNNVAVSYLKNIESENLENIKYGYYSIVNPQEAPRQKLRLLKKAVKSLNLSSFSKAAIHGLELRIIPRQSIYGADAMVEPGSGNILISSDLDTNEYQQVLGNELSHVEIRYSNLKKCGTDLPEERMSVFYPFLNPDWSINLEMRNKLEKTLSTAHKKIHSFIKLYNDAAHINSEQQNQVNEIILLINGNSVTDQNLNVDNFINLFLEREQVAQNYYMIEGGLNRQLLEQVSDISEFSPAVQEYFFQDVIDYLNAYHALSCELENNPNTMSI